MQSTLRDNLNIAPDCTVKKAIISWPLFRLFSSLLISEFLYFNFDFFWTLNRIDNTVSPVFFASNTHRLHFLTVVVLVSFQHLPTFASLKTFKVKIYECNIGQID